MPAYRVWKDLGVFSTVKDGIGHGLQLYVIIMIVAHRQLHNR